MATKIESEKTLDQKLRKGVEALGGLCLKFESLHVCGYPDRFIFLPGGRVWFVEVKSTKKSAEKLQKIRHAELRAMGFRVEVLDNSNQLNRILCEMSTSDY